MKYYQKWNEPWHLQLQIRLCYSYKNTEGPFYVEIGQNTAVQIKYPQILIPQEMRTPKNEYLKKWIHGKDARQNLQLDTYLISQAL